MSESRLNAYLKAKGITGLSGDEAWIKGTGYTLASEAWAAEYPETAEWMIPGGAALETSNEGGSTTPTGSDSSTSGAVTGSDSSTSGAVTGSDTPSVTGSDDDDDDAPTTGSATGSEGDDDPTTGIVTGPDSEVEPVVDTVTPQTAEELNNIENPEEVNIDLTNQEVVDAVNENTYYNNININGE